MNGRVYDPATAMFFSPDPFVQSPGNWSNYNRYSYVSNNPTKFTDPSGYIQANLEMPWFDPSWTRIMNAYGSSGRGFDVSKPYGGKTGDITYDWVAHNNGSPGEYSDAQGNDYDWGNVHDNYILPRSNPDWIYKHNTTGGGISGNFIDGFKLNGVLYEFKKPLKYGEKIGIEGNIHELDGISNALNLSSILVGIMTSPDSYEGALRYYKNPLTNKVVSWTAKNGALYKVSQIKMNGGLKTSINIAKGLSNTSRIIGNIGSIFGIVTSSATAGIAVYNGTHNTSTWVNAGIGIGTGILTIVAAPEVVAVAAIGGIVWGISQLVAGDKINDAIDDNFGY